MNETAEKKGRAIKLGRVVSDKMNKTKVGDRVRIEETRPLSKLKRWRLREIVTKA